jgi:hypothetical protein
MGGAVATLAAYDLLQMCPKLDKLRQVSTNGEAPMTLSMLL